jgi:hypothetical protein
VDFLPDRDILDLSGKVILVTGGKSHHRHFKCIIANDLYRDWRLRQSRHPRLNQEEPFQNLSHRPQPITMPTADRRNPKRASHRQSKGHPSPTQVRPRRPQNRPICRPRSSCISNTKTRHHHRHRRRNARSPESHKRWLRNPIWNKPHESCPPHQIALPLLLKSLDGRIVLFTSQGFGLHPSGGILFDSLHSTQEKQIRLATRWELYGQSKLANLLYSVELARRYPSVTSVSVHPGVVNTGGFSSLGWWDRFTLTALNFNNFMTPEERSRNALWSVTAPLYRDQKRTDNESTIKDERIRGKGFVVNGAYYEPVGAPGKHSRKSTDEDLAKRLWE